MTTRKLLAVIGILLLASSPATFAGDESGLFSIRGAGLLTCATYVEERQAASEAYIMIGGWLDGYITAINELSTDTFDITPYQTTELLTILIDRHCRNNPQDLVYAVTRSLLARMHEERLKAPSPQVDVRVGLRQLRLYEKTISRIQTELVNLGMLDVEITGSWNRSTEDALAAYQKSAGLDGSGFPDQVTLWRLLGAD